MNKLYGYARASTNEQQLTMTAQEARIKQEYDLRFKDDYTWGGLFADLGVSGSIALLRRPAGFRLNVELEKGDAVVITKLDRGFRNVRDFLDVLDTWQEKGVRLILLDMAIDTGLPVGRLMATVLAAFGEFERERGRERTREVLAERRRLGLPVGRPPLGFRTVGGKDKRTVVMCPNQRTTMGIMYEWWAEGCTYEEIVKNLAREKVKRARGNEWTLGSVHRAVAAEKRLREIEALGITPRPEHLKTVRVDVPESNT